MQEIYEHNTIKFNWGRRFFKKTPSPIELCFFLVRFSPICHMFCWFSAINTFIRDHRFIFDQTSCSSSACLIFHFAFTYWISTPTCFYESAIRIVTAVSMCAFRNSSALLYISCWIVSRISRSFVAISSKDTTIFSRVSRRTTTT